MKSYIELEQIADAHVVFGIQKGIHCLQMGITHGGIQGCHTGAGILCGNRPRVERVINGIASETDVVIRRRDVIEIGFQIQIVDAGEVVKRKCFGGQSLVFLFDAYIELVAAVGECGVGEQLLIDDVVPAKRRGDVTPLQTEFLFTGIGCSAIGVGVFAFEIEFVVAGVDAEIQAVFLGKSVVDLGVQVVEIITSR